MIEAVGLTKLYGARRAVDNITFTVAAGETVGFLGANGAGKSTTQRMLAGFLPPSAGSARIAGFDVAQHPLEARRRLGYLPESNPLYRDMRVTEFLHYRARLKGLPRAARRTDVGYVLERCRLVDMAGRIIGQLSKGYRQRVGLADVLLGRPPLLMLDEPTVGLDPNQVRETRDLIRDLGTDRTVLLSTHILHEVERLCRRVIILDRGRLVADGATETLCRDYAGDRILALALDASAFPPETELTALLRRVPGVKNAIPERDAADDDAGGRRYRLTATAGHDPRRALAALAGEKGWLILEMRLEPVRLEDIFAQLTRPHRAAAATGEGR